MFTAQFFLEHWHDIAYIILAIAAAVAYALHFFFPQAKLLSSQSLLMLVLIFVLLIATRMESLAGDLHGEVRALSANLDNLALSNGYARVEKIGNADAMFRLLLEQLRAAQKEIHVTSIRAEDPTAFKTQSSAAELWYDELRKWPEGGAGRLLYRLIAVPNKQMEQWFDVECKQNKSKANYELAALPWDGKVATINVVVFDQKEAFLVFSPPGGPLGETQFYHITDAALSHLIVERYFKYLEKAARPCN